MIRGSAFDPARAKPNPPPKPAEYRRSLRVLQRWQGRNLALAGTPELEQVRQLIELEPRLDSNFLAQRLLANIKTELGSRNNP